MPIYTYNCTSCEHQFDLVQKMDAPEYAACPECGQEAVRGIARPSQFVWGRGGGLS